MSITLHFLTFFDFFFLHLIYNLSLYISNVNCSKHFWHSSLTQHFGDTASYLAQKVQATFFELFLLLKTFYLLAKEISRSEHNKEMRIFKAFFLFFVKLLWYIGQSSD